MKTVPFSSLSVGSTFVNPKTGWTMKKLADSWKGAGRAEFGAGAPVELIGKDCSFNQTKKVSVE